MNEGQTPYPDQSDDRVRSSSETERDAIIGERICFERGKNYDWR